MAEEKCAGLELRICRRKRVDRPDKPGCHFNLSEKRFAEWSADLKESFLGIRIKYSAFDCLGLCPKKGVTIQIGARPVVVSGREESKEHINAYIKNSDN